MSNSACIEFGRAQLREEEIAGKAVLEVGALDVNGSLRPFVEELKPSMYVGVDLWTGPGVDEVCAAEHLVPRFGDERFDLVLATEVLEHVADWRAAVDNIKTVLKPGGVALVTTRSPGFPYHGHPADFWRFQSADLETIFDDFEIDKLEADPTMPGVFLKARKRPGAPPVDLSALEPQPVAPRRRSPRGFRVLWHGVTRALAALPLGVRSSRQLAREAVAAGAIQKVPELARLVGLVRALRPAAVLEIGSYRGATLGAWCNAAASDALVVSVDLPAEYGTPASRDELRAFARAGQRVEVVRGDSHEDATRREVERLLAGSALDFLMIDGDHTYEGVRRDFELYSTLVRDGGLVAFHDVIPHRGIAGVEVERLWSELKPHFEHEEFLTSGHEIGFGPWGGIGVLRFRRDAALP